MNAAGTGEPSAESLPVTPATTPGAPTGVDAVAWHRAATVTFVAPASTGGSPITGYSVTPSPLTVGWHDNDAGTTSLTHEIAGLINGTAYTFTVRATNAIGQGSTSAPSNVATPYCDIFCDGFESNNTLAGWTPPPSLTVAKSETSSGPYTAGQTISYSIVVTNSGFVTLTGVTVNDPSAIVGTCTPALPATLLPNQPLSCSATHLVSPADISAGSYTNTATANSVETGASSDSVTIEFPSADISVSKTDASSTETPGTQVTYVITVSNGGPLAAPSVTVTDNFPSTLAGCSTICVGAGGGSCTAGPVSGDLSGTANLPVGGSAVYTATCTIDSSATGTLVNTASATVGGGLIDPNAANNSATDADILQPKADLAISNTDGLFSVSPGQPITYTIVAWNTGPSDEPTATIIDIFPVECENPAWTCLGAGGGSCGVGGSGTIWEFVSLPAGGSVTFSADCTVSASATGTMANPATVVHSAEVIDPNLSNNGQTDTDTVTGPPT